MNKFYIEGTKTTPEVKLDPENMHFEIAGESYPEDSVAFYKPVIDWLTEFISQKPEFTFSFKMNYFNTSSSKAVMDIIDVLEDYHNDGGKVSLEWHYQEDDEDIKDSGEEFIEDLNIPTSFIEYK